MLQASRGLTRHPESRYINARVVRRRSWLGFKDAAYSFGHPRCVGECQSPWNSTRRWGSGPATEYGCHSALGRPGKRSGKGAMTDAVEVASQRLVGEVLLPQPGRQEMDAARGMTDSGQSSSTASTASEAGRPKDPPKTETSAPPSPSSLASSEGPGSCWRFLALAMRSPGLLPKHSQQRPFPPAKFCCLRDRRYYDLVRLPLMLSRISVPTLYRESSPASTARGP